MKEKNRFRKFSWLAAFLVLVHVSCGAGWHYDWLSYENYGPGKVRGAPETMEYEAPVIDETVPSLDVFAVGCAGAGNRGQEIVAGMMAETAGENGADFVLYLGDNFYGRGVDSVNDPQWKTKFEDVYHQSSLQIPFYAVLGNHDYYRNPGAQVEYSRTSKRWKMPERYYGFSSSLEDGTRIDFFALDTPALAAGRDSMQLEWLDRQLRESEADWKIVFAHHPLYSGDRRRGIETEQMRNFLEPLLVRHGVDLYLSAHSHNVEITKPVSGVTYIVSGAGSRPRDLTWGEQTLFASADLGFVWLRFTAAGIEIRVIGTGGLAYAFTVPSPAAAGG